ncbi:hypothetical protein V6N13_118284 [Hibiscus sabdariffa]
MTSPRCTIEPRKECSVLELAVGTSSWYESSAAFKLLASNQCANISAVQGERMSLAHDETRAQTLGKENVCFTFDSCILALPLIVNGSPTFASTSTVQAESDTRKYEPHGHAHK